VLLLQVYMKNVQIVFCLFPMFLYTRLFFLVDILRLMLIITKHLIAVQTYDRIDNFTMIKAHKLGWLYENIGYLLFS